MTLLDGLKESIKGTFMVFLSFEEREAMLCGILMNSVVDKVRKAIVQGDSSVQGG